MSWILGEVCNGQYEGTYRDGTGSAGVSVTPKHQPGWSSDLQIVAHVLHLIRLELAVSPAPRVSDSLRQSRL
jgi:hypothetical protein